MRSSSPELFPYQPTPNHEPFSGADDTTIPLASRLTSALGSPERANDPNGLNDSNVPNDPNDPNG
jgi:hypothetical protein